MKLLSKRVRIGKYAIPALILLSLAVGSVAAVAYVVIQWSISLTVGTNPAVHFLVDGSPSNTMTVSMTIFPSIRTIDENVANRKIQSTGARVIYVRVSAMDTLDVAEVKIKAFNGTNTLFEQTWSAQTTTWSGPYSTASSDYNLWIEVLGASSPTSPASITIDMKVENP